MHPYNIRFVTSQRHVALLCHARKSIYGNCIFHERASPRAARLITFLIRYLLIAMAGIISRSGGPPARRRAR